jgi:uncharacterized protein
MWCCQASALKAYRICERVMTLFCFSRLILLLPALAALTPGTAAAGFDCTGKDADRFTAVCRDAEIMRLDQAVDASFMRAQHAVDPVTAMLLSRDQDWVMEIAGGQYAQFKGADDPARQRIIAVLQQRLAMLDHIASRADGAAGAWSNAFGAAKVTVLPAGLMRVDVRTKAAYGDDSGLVTCALAAQVKLGDDGWLSGPAAVINDDREPTSIARDSPIMLRARQQANTLRIVIVHDDDQSVCDKPENLTASYFPIAAASAAATANAPPPMTAPSFNCAMAKNSDEEEICADPELAEKDVAIAAAYNDAMHRLDAKSADYLRDDERAWVADNRDAYDSQIHAAWDKQSYFVHHTGGARGELKLRLKERLAMLKNLDEKRQGEGGLWVGHTAMLAIAPDKDKPGKLQAAGHKWETGDWKSHCDFEADGKMVGGNFKTDDEFPKLARDAASLTLGDETSQPGYCVRMISPKARLFPVNEGADIGFNDSRIR